ncbi:hypothetical protein Tco_0381883 [Tanacetum coccineum]
MKAIYNIDVPVDSQAPKTSSQTKKVPQGKKPGAKSGLRRKQSSKHTFESKTEASKSKTGQSNKEIQSSLAKDKSPSHPSPSTPVVGEMHKEAQQAASGPTSLGATNEEGAHLRLSSGTNPSFLVDKTKSVGDGLQTAHTDSDARSAFFTPNSSHDEPIIVSDKSEEKEEAEILERQAGVTKAKVEAKVASLKARPSYPDINQLTELLVTSLKPEFSKLLASHDFVSCLPIGLKELPSNFTELYGDIKELKKHVQDMEIELPGDLKEIPTKLETFTFTISSLTSQKKLKTLNSLPSLLNKVTDILNRFVTVMENASGATSKNVPSAGQATASPVEGEKNTNPATKDAETTKLHNELVDILGIDVVTQYYNKKLLYDKYCDKMLKRRKSSKIINCDVLTQKGPITLQVYREDRTLEVISNVKVSDLYLSEWKEVVQAYPGRKEKGWKTIYGLIKTRMEYLNQTEKELKIDFNKPLKEQDPLNELNDLANKKMKRTGDSKDHSRSTKKHKLSVQHEEEIVKYLHFSLGIGSKTEEGLCKELQFSLVDNSKLNVVYLLNRSLKRCVSLLEGLEGGEKIALCQKE